MIRNFKGFNDIEYAAIKQAAKKELSFRVAIRRCKRKYAYNAISIRPFRVEKFTHEQVDEVILFCKKHKIVYNRLNTNFTNPYIIYNLGFNLCMIEC